MQRSIQSTWIDEVPVSVQFPKLTNDITVDIAIVGGGITGITLAYYLRQTGKKVCVLEKSTIASGETAYTTAFITQVFDTYLQDIEKQFDRSTAKIVWDAGGWAINEIEKIAQSEKIQCEFQRCSAFIFPRNDDEKSFLEREYNILCDLGYTSVTWDTTIEFLKDTYLQVPNQAKFQPRQFVMGLAERCVKSGVEIFEKTQVINYEGKGPLIIKTDQATVTAEKVVIATHHPNDDAHEFSTRLNPMQTYVLAGRIPEHVLPEALYWDTADPYHYIRVDNKGTYDRLIIGGEDHKTGEDTDPSTHYAALETYWNEVFPNIDYTLYTQWSGQVLETTDGLPIIGESLLRPNHYIATGFAGNGMTFGVISAEILYNALMGTPHDWQSTFSPARTPLNRID